METNAAVASSHYLYEDFEPFCKWLTEKEQETLEIDLKGFKKEQLKVQTNNKGFLTIYGERPLDASTSKWSRFHKEIRLSKNCIVNGISAKFSNGILSIIMPKMVKARGKENTKEAFLEATQHVKDDTIEKHSILEVTRKKRAIEVAVKVVAVVSVVVAIGTYIAIS
ncbi:unnamed protein product [Lupinus luteus]|uniref:SHSP domain-containing protein n=1 Tax=Lupinus luteus TaxID=3873 RepID=A0AAV1XQ79_LUPLU